jgi:hypothetical protein
MKKNISTKLSEADIKKSKLASMSREQIENEILKRIADEAFKKMSHHLIMPPLPKGKIPKGKK